MASFEQFIQESPQQVKEKKIGNYLIQKTLGKGTFGKVKLATHIPTGEKVAIKILEKDKIVDVADVERVSREIHILKLIRHPNIIQLYEIIQTPKHLFLVMEYMEKGELFDYIVKKRKMDEDQACKVFQHIISGIEYIHKLRIVHRDLKLENLLIGDQIGKQKTIRIVDFGLSNTYKAEERLRTACGSPCYAAPEMIEGKSPYEPVMVDIWSAGVILFAMVCGCLPFEEPDNTPKLYKKILSGQYELSSHISEQLADFIKRILTVDPKQRIRFEGMKEHVWWKKHSDHYYPEGLIVGYHKIPIDQNILKEVKSLGYDIELTAKSLEANRHNNLTTTYYLIMKKYLHAGGISSADFSGKQFDKTAIQPNERKLKSTKIHILDNLKPSDLIKMVTSPIDNRDKTKPYFFPHQKPRYDDPRDRMGNHSVRVDQRRKSKSKEKSKGKIGKEAVNMTCTRDLPVPHYNVQHDKIMRGMSQGQIKSNKKNSSKSMSNKTKKSPTKIDLSGVDEEYLNRPRSISQKNKIGLKKSHQGSYMIGADTGHDWPLEPKYKGEGGGKIKSAMRRR